MTLSPAPAFEGSLLLDGKDINAPGRDVVEIRRLVGMVFQKPNPFPKAYLIISATASR